MRTLLTIATKTGRLLGPAFLALSLLVFGVLALGPRTGRYRTVTVLTASMRPTMPEGAMVLATPAQPADLKVGDVITYRIPVQDRRLVTHRVVEILQPGANPIVRTKGDANNGVDPWTAQLKGGTVWKARGAVPKVGYVAEWLRKPHASRLLVLIVPFFLALLWLKDIWRDDDEPPVNVAIAPPASPVVGALAAVALLSLGAFTARHRA
ncbi:MAG TPA: signal peptidase I [Acidimicrobiales bacterium]